MGKRGRAPKPAPNQLLSLAELGKSEQFAKSLVTKRVRIGKKANEKAKITNLREGLVRRHENEVEQKVVLPFYEQYAQLHGRVAVKGKL